MLSKGESITSVLELVAVIGFQPLKPQRWMSDFIARGVLLNNVKTSRLKAAVRGASVPFKALSLCLCR